MRRKPSPGGHDPRQIDLLAVFALIVMIVAVGHYLIETEHPKLTSRALSSRARPCAGEVAAAFVRSGGVDLAFAKVPEAMECEC